MIGEDGEQLGIKQTAEALDLSVAAANSALQRARATLAEHALERDAAGTETWEPTEEEQRLLAGFIDAHTHDDLVAITAPAATPLVTSDSRRSARSREWWAGG